VPRTIEIRVSGKVQKVGLRNCVRRIAGNLNIRGQVMNLPDGSVRVMATADPVILEKFISMIYGCPRAVIRDLQVSEVASRHFQDFSVVRLEE